MRTRSQSRNSIRQQQQVNPTFVEPFNLVEPIENQAPPVVTMDDTRTMAQLLEAPTVGYEDANDGLEITATKNFELQHGFAYPLTKQTFFLDRHKKTLKLTFRFQQRFDETFYEAWDQFNDLLRACPHHGFSELHQLDTFYNALNSNDQDSLNSVAGGNFLDKIPRDCLRIIESKSKVRNSRNKPVVAKVSSSSSTLGISPDVAELKDMVKALLLDKKSQAPAPVKAVEGNCVTCGGAHSYRNCPATDGNVYSDNIQEYVSQAAAANFNQGNTGPIHQPQVNEPSAYQAPAYQASAPQTQGVSKDDFQNYVKANDAVMRNMQNQNQNLQNQMTNLTDMLSIFMNYNIASTSGSGTLPSNIITNPKVDLKGITTRSGVAYQGPTIPTTTSSPPRVVERETEVTKETVLPTNNGSTKDVQPPVVQVQSQIPNSEPVVAPVSAPMPNSKPSIPYLSRRNDERRREKANNQIVKFYQIFQDLHFKISFTDALILMPKFASTLKSLIGNKEKLSEMARTPLNKHCSAVLLKKLPKKLGDLDKFLIRCDFPRMVECLALADLGPSINLMPLSVWKMLSLPELTPTCMTLELADRSITQPIGIAEDVDVKVGKYSSNYDDNLVNRIDIIEMACEEYSQEVLGFSDVIMSSNPTPYYDPIVSTSSPTLTPFRDSDFLLEEVDAFLALEDDPTLPEVDDSYYDPEGDILLLEAFLNDDPSLPPPTQGNYLPEIRKELKVCEAKTDKSSIDEPPEVELKDLPPHLEYTFLEGNDKLPVIIAKDLSVEEKAALIKVLKSHKRAMAWKLFDIKGINPEFCTHKILMEEDYKPAVQHQRRGTFQRCMMAIFHDMIEKTMEVFMDDFSVFGNSFGNCLSRVDKMLQRCEDTNLCLNWENSHFMVKEGIVLGHKISKNRIEVDKAKVDVIAKLPHPTTVKGVRSFLGHAGFYRWFIKDFSKISRPMTHLLEKNTPFIFSNECIQAFETLKKKLTEAPMPIHYASKTMNEAESHYTTTEKEMLAVAKKLLTSSQLAIVDPPGDITVPTTPPKRFLTQDFIGPRFTEMPMTWSPDVTLVSVKEKFRNVMKCLKIPSKFAKSLTYGASISWGRSRLHEGTNTYSWPSTICQNGAPRAIISDRGTHFSNDQFAKVMLKYGVTQRLSTAYHPQISGQVEDCPGFLKPLVHVVLSFDHSSFKSSASFGKSDI
ncbi:reverse transcriptase domain-containing protein [Tanacetum coccineum]